MGQDWDDDEEEEDKVKGEDKHKDKQKKTPQINPRFFAAMTLTLQPPKPSITEYIQQDVQCNSCNGCSRRRVQT